MSMYDSLFALTKRLVFVTIMVMMGCTLVLAIPSTITYKGKLADSSLTPVTGVQSITFRLYDDRGTELWSEVQAVTLSDGHFTAELGNVTPLSTAIFNSDGITLGVQIGSDAELSPRVSLGVVPFAFQAKSLEGNTLSLHSSGHLEATTHIVPSSQDTYDLGSPERRFRDVYVSTGSIHIGTPEEGIVLSYEKAATEDDTPSLKIRHSQSATKAVGLSFAGGEEVDSSVSAMSSNALFKTGHVRKFKKFLRGQGEGGHLAFWYQNTNLAHEGVGRGTRRLVDAEGLFWDFSNSRLGIGTTTPGEALDIVGNIAFSGFLKEEGSTAASGYNSGYVGTNIYADGGTVGVGVSGTLKSYINRDGRGYFVNDITLGGALLSNTLDTDIKSNWQPYILKPGSDSTGEFLDIYVPGNPGGTNTVQANPIIRLSDKTNNSAYVGIGTTEPSSRLHVDGDVKATSYEGSGAALTGVSLSNGIQEWTVPSHENTHSYSALSHTHSSLSAKTHDHDTTYAAPSHGHDGDDITYTFTTCGSSGRTGPTSGCTDGLGNAVSVSNGIQEWTVPETGVYTIETWGAQGGIGGAPNSWAGGKGARMKGDFSLTAGTVLKILVGQQGTTSSYNNGGSGGGGGTFVVDGTTALIVSGGGGGGARNSTSSHQTGDHAPVTNSGDQAGTDGGGYGNGKGAGFSQDSPDGAQSFMSGGNGDVQHRSTYSAEGGFGGAASASAHLGGGGGGYSGGNGGYLDGQKSTGGGSYNTGDNQDNTAGANEGNGRVVITVSSSDVYAASTHAHDDVYSSPTHSHNYSASSHDSDHNYALESHLEDHSYAATTHDHNSNYSLLSHSGAHSYAAPGHNHEANYSLPSHSGEHSYAAPGHNHGSAFSLSSHNHGGHDTNYTFTTCGSSGRTGPTSGCTDGSGNAVFVSNGIQEWTVPANGVYSIEVLGAQGGNAGSAIGGKGAKMKGDFTLSKDDVIKIVVGQQGLANNYDSGGGGGTFVVKKTGSASTDITSLIIAGGGGGSNTWSSIPDNGGDAGTGTAGSTGDGNTGTPGDNGTGGSGSYSSSGGGLLTDGGPATWGSNIVGGGYAFVNGALGGDRISSDTVVGGFGGGGSAHGNSCIGGAGGGGYSGGTGSNSYCNGGGGGGSYNTGDNQDNTAGANEGHGRVVISGSSSAMYADSSHDHGSDFSPTSHTHGYAAASHSSTHDSTYSDSNHTHSYSGSGHTHSFSASNHTHSSAASVHTHGFAESGHGHTSTYDVNDSWFRENGDNAHFKVYGGTKQIVFRTDNSTEYASGVGGFPYAWMYGGDTSSHRRMLLNTSGQLWTSNYSWLHSKFAYRNGAAGQAFSAADFYADTGVSVAGGWLDVHGNNGVYWENRGGGWYMSDSTWLRSHNNKEVYASNTIYAGGDIRTNIFYDGDTATRYMDPNSWSKLNNLIIHDRLQFGHNGDSWMDDDTSDTDRMHSSDAAFFAPVSNGSISDLRLYILDDTVDRFSIWGDTCGGGNCGNLGNARERFRFVMDGRGYMSSSKYANQSLQSSDRRMKKEIKDLSAQQMLEIVLQMQAVTFMWKDQVADSSSLYHLPGTYYGFIAQDIQSLLPHAIHTNTFSGMLELDYTAIIPVVLEAFKAQQPLINDIKEKQTRSKSLSEDLLRRVQALEVQ